MKSWILYNNFIITIKINILQCSMNLGEAFQNCVEKGKSKRRGGSGSGMVDEEHGWEERERAAFGQRCEEKEPVVEEEAADNSVTDNRDSLTPQLHRHVVPIAPQLPHLDWPVASPPADRLIGPWPPKEAHHCTPRSSSHPLCPIPLLFCAFDLLVSVCAWGLAMAGLQAAAVSQLSCVDALSASFQALETKAARPHGVAQGMYPCGGCGVRSEMGFVTRSRGSMRMVRVNSSAERGPSGDAGSAPPSTTKKVSSILCKNCDGNGAVACSQCEGGGVNTEDHFGGRFKTGQTCWLCRGKRQMLCGDCNGAGFMGGFMNTQDEWGMRWFEGWRRFRRFGPAGERPSFTICEFSVAVLNLSD